MTNDKLPSQYMKEVFINSEIDVLKARVMGKKIAAAVGFGEIGLAEIEIVISELGTNIVKHANMPGIISFRSLIISGVRGIEIIASDQGSGIKNIELMMAGGNSTTGTLGIGLSGVKRLMDEFDFETGEKGTIFRAKKWIKKDYRFKVHCSVLSKPKIGERLSGDAYFFKQLPMVAIFSVIDALGHGPDAHQVAVKALTSLENNYHQELISIIEYCHNELKGTRGAAMSLGKIDFNTCRFQHISIGNIQTKIYGTPAPIKPVCINGTLGMIMESIRINTYPYSRGSCIVMFSDGISDKFNIEPALLRKTPQEISNFIFTNYSRKYDDATVLVVK